ncbi:acylphosphatase [Candidatus Amarolinea dominans]|uniref:acylphosphatase n=1 Tax=Candidatus Amarolinea dominans TaxID=3140696 RepID=UPI0031CC3F41
MRKPEPPLYQVDPSMAPGVKSRWIGPWTDATWWWRVIKQGEQVLQQDKFVSKYQPWLTLLIPWLAQRQMRAVDDPSMTLPRAERKTRPHHSDRCRREGVLTMQFIRMHVWIRGVVQGVFFRQSTRRQAQAAGVTGWVRNCADRAGEAVFERRGCAVASVVSWCLMARPPQWSARLTWQVNRIRANLACSRSAGRLSVLNCQIFDC